jgi:hypothetical protein
MAIRRLAGRGHWAAPEIIQVRRDFGASHAQREEIKTSFRFD